MTIFRNLPPQLFVPPQGPLPDVRFRRARQSDEPRLHYNCYSHRSRARFHDDFRRSLRAQAAGNRVHVVAVRVKSDALIASGQLIRHSDRVEIADLIVNSLYREQGIGTALIKILEQIAAHARFPDVEIGVMAANERALALYRRLGFTEKGEILVPGPAKAIILHKILPTPANL